MYFNGNPPDGGWAGFNAAIHIRVNGAEAPKTWGVTPNRSTTFPGSVATVGVALSEPAPAGGVTFFLTPRLGTDIPTGLCTNTRFQAATRENLGASLPSTLRVPAGRKEATVKFPLTEDGYLVGGPGRCFAVTAHTDAPRWSLGGQSSVEVSVSPGEGFVAFGNNARNSNKYVASVAENESGGTLNVPVTVNRLPATSTTVAVEVVTGGTTAATGDYRIGTASVTFGPRDTSLTKNIAVTVVDDDKRNGDRTLALRFAQARGGLYALRLNSAELTILDDEEPAPNPPSAVRVTPGHENLLVTWTAHTGRLTGYDVHYTASTTVAADEAAQTGSSPEPADGWVDAGYTNTIASHVIGGLSNGTAYRVRVRANNNFAKGAWGFASGTPVQTTRTFAFQFRIGQPTEEGSDARFTVVLGEAAPSEGLRLTLTPAYGTGANHAGPADVGSAAPATVTVPGGQTQAEFTYPVAQDNLVEFNEEFRLVLGAGTAGRRGWSAAPSSTRGPNLPMAARSPSAPIPPRPGSIPPRSPRAPAA